MTVDNNVLVVLSSYQLKCCHSPRFEQLLQNSISMTNTQFLHFLLIKSKTLFISKRITPMIFHHYNRSFLHTSKMVRIARHEVPKYVQICSIIMKSIYRFSFRNRANFSFSAEMARHIRCLQFDIVRQYFPSRGPYKLKFMSTTSHYINELSLWLIFYYLQASDIC